MQISAIIPLKKTSVRVPNKNFRNFSDTSLFEIKISSLLEIEEIDNIIINSDSQEVIDLVKSKYSSDKIVYVKRESFFASSECSGSKFFKNIAENAIGDVLIYSPVTSPFVKNETLKGAIRKYVDGGFDSVVSVHSMKHHSWMDGRPLNYDVENSPNSQDLKAIQKITYGFGILDKNLMIRKKNIIGDKPFFYDLDEIESIDIDSELDFMFAEFVYEYNKNI